MNYLQCVVLEGWHKSGYSKSGETARIKDLISFVMYALEAKRMLCRKTGSIIKRWLNYCLSALSPALEADTFLGWVIGSTGIIAKE